MKLTVTEYAKKLNVSVQTIYKKIKRGSLDTIIQNGKTYVIADSSEFKTEVKTESDKDYKSLLKIIKSLQKENKRLAKQLDKCHSKKDSVLDKFLGMALLTSKPKDDAIDVEIKPKKKKKRKQ